MEEEHDGRARRGLRSDLEIQEVAVRRSDPERLERQSRLGPEELPGDGLGVAPAEPRRRREGRRPETGVRPGSCVRRGFGDPHGRVLVRGGGVPDNRGAAARRNPSPRRRLTVSPRLSPPILPILALLAGSGCAGGMAGDSIPVPVPPLPPPDGLLGSAALQEVVDLQVAREGEALGELLGSPDPRVRARAAFALASVQDAAALEALAGLLADPSPEVRANAAFALGQLPLADGGTGLLEALAGEEEAPVRLRLIEALGKRGGLEAVGALARGPARPGEEEARTLAVSRAALREVRPPGVLEYLAERLTHPDPEVRYRSAYYFGRAASVSAWAGFVPGIRAALDGSAPGDPAAMYLVQALGRLGDVEADAARIARWMVAATDWRTRVNAASSVMSPRWLASAPVQDGLLAALADPSGHVRAVAAESAALLAWSSEDWLDRAADRVAGEPAHWRSQIPFAPPLVGQGRAAVVLDWVRRMADFHPVAARLGIESLGGVPPGDVMDLLLELAEHPEPEVRAGATWAIGQRWGRGAAGEIPAERVFDLLVRRLGDAENLPALRAARALAHPSFAPLGSAGALEAAFRSRRPAGDPNILVPILESMGDASITLLRAVAAGEDFSLRAAAARAIERITGEQVPIAGNGETGPVPGVEWARLAELGREPRLRFETDRGVIVVRLFTEQAPLTVQTFVDQVLAGAHDGTRFHRVVPNFVVQGGDVGVGDGSGGTGTPIRSEFTQIPFGRGVIGMASEGKDTEESQYYLTHSPQPHLEGGYTAFGYIEEGAGTLDLLQEGDQVVGVTLED